MTSQEQSNNTKLPAASLVENRPAAINVTEKILALARLCREMSDSDRSFLNPTIINELMVRDIVLAPLVVLMKARPELCRIIDTYGNQSISQYFKEMYSSTRGVSNNFRSAVRTVARRYYPEQIVEELDNYFRSHNVVDTAQHLQPIAQPMNFIASLIQSRQATNEGFSVFPVLACSNVSLDNETGPASIRHGKKSYRFIHGHGLSDDAVIASIQLGEFIKPFEKYQPPQKLMQLLRTVDSMLPTKPNVAHFVANFNTTLWNSIDWQTVCDSTPAIPIFLPQEEVLKAYLITELEGKEGAIFELFNNQNKLRAFINATDGRSIPGAASHLFWEINSRGKHVPLRLSQSNEELITKFSTPESPISIKMNPACIVAALNERNLLPTLPLDYFLMLGEGLQCFGGYGQIEYLPKLKSMLSQFYEGDDLRIQLANEAPADLMIRGPLLGGMYDELNGREIFPISSAAALITPHKALPAIWRQMDSTTLAQALLLAAPEIYQGLFGQSEREELGIISRLTYQDVFKHLEFDSI